MKKKSDDNIFIGGRNILSSASDVMFVLGFVGFLFAVPILFIMEKTAYAIFVTGLYFLVFGAITVYGSKFKKVIPYIVFS